MGAGKCPVHVSVTRQLKPISSPAINVNTNPRYGFTHRHSAHNTTTSKREMKLLDPSKCQTPFPTQKTCLSEGMTNVCMACTILNFPYEKH
jgi:hypothetical protein